VTANVLDKARRRYTWHVAVQTGRSYTAALTLLAKPGILVLAGSREHPHPQTLPWAALTGMTITADSHTGVVLSGTGPAHPEIFRLILLDSGQVALFNPRFFDLAPMPGERPPPVKGRRRYVTECPEGRPVYRSADFPSGVLATETMLKHLRRVLAPQLKPVASYLAMKDYYPLYPLADCPPMPEQSPRRAARWSAVRTCAGCAAESLKPWMQYQNLNSLRLCASCVTAFRESQRLARENVDRMTAETHMREVMAHPTAGLLHTQVSYSKNEAGHGTRNTVVTLAAVATGQITAVHHLTGRTTAGAFQHPDDAEREAGLKLIESLSAYSRFLTCGHDDLRTVEIALWEIGDPGLQLAGSGGWGTRAESGDLRWVFAEWWRGRLEYPADGRFGPDWGDRNDDFRYAAIVGGPRPAGKITECWNIMCKIAGGEHPGGPAVCPFRGSYQHERCGSPELAGDGFCHGHQDRPF
jgi:hypothetical protein